MELGAAALAPLFFGGGDTGIARDESRTATFYVQASQTLKMITEKDVQFQLFPTQSHQSSPWEPEVPKGAHRHPKGAKGSPK